MNTENNTNNEVTIEEVIDGHTAIIGKIWTNGSMGVIDDFVVVPKDIVFKADTQYLIGSLSFRTDRNLNTSTVPGQIAPLTMKAGDKLYFRPNDPRTDGIHTQDPDITVSIKTTKEFATTIIDNSKAGRIAWKEANQPQQAPQETVAEITV